MGYFNRGLSRIRHGVMIEHFERGEWRWLPQNAHPIAGGASFIERGRAFVSRSNLACAIAYRTFMWAAHRLPLSRP